MNTKQKLHQIKLQQWASRFQEQASSGRTVKAWCTENNISIHTYNYWKHLLKQEYVESTLSEQHDIVPLTMHAPDLTVPSTPVAVPLSHHVHVYAAKNNDGTIIKTERPADLFHNSIAKSSVRLNFPKRLTLISNG